MQTGGDGGGWEGFQGVPRKGDGAMDVLVDGHSVIPVEDVEFPLDTILPIEELLKGASEYY